MKKEKIYLVLTTIFTILTLSMAGYILAKEGKVNAGYALIPCLFSIIFSNLCIREKNKNNKLNKKQLEKHNKITKIIIIIAIVFIILNIISAIILSGGNNSNNLIEVKPSIKKEITKSVIVDKIDNSYTIYYYGINDAIININEEKIDLAEAISEGKITFEDLIEELKIYNELNDGGTLIYKDGGTKKYLTDNYTLIKCKTIEGNRDIYVGNKDMEYEESFCK